jgi:hypothetical protein
VRVCVAFASVVIKYHAVALATPGAELVTADTAYFRKAAREGSIRHLADWR